MPIPIPAAAINMASITPSFCGMAAIVLPPNRNTIRSITSMPHGDTHANTSTNHGSHHAQASVVNPAIVTNPADGDANGFADTDNNGNFGSINTRVGRVNNYAVMIVATISATSCGIARSKASASRPANNTVPNAAAEDEANS